MTEATFVVFVFPIQILCSLSTLLPLCLFTLFSVANSVLSAPAVASVVSTAAGANDIQRNIDRNPIQLSEHQGEEEKERSLQFHSYPIASESIVFHSTSTTSARKDAIKTVANNAAVTSDGDKGGSLGNIMPSQLRWEQVQTHLSHWQLLLKALVQMIVLSLFY